MTSETEYSSVLEPKPGSENHSFLKLERDGRGHLIQPPSEEVEQLPGWAASFLLAASPGLGIAGYCYPGYWVSVALCVCDIEGLQFWTLGQGKCALWCGWCMTPGASHETTLFQLYSVSTPSADFTCFMCSFIQQILLSCSWVSVAGLHSGTVTMRHHCLCTAYKESWGECSPSDLLTSLSASMSMGMVFCLSLHPALWCLVSFCFVYFPFCVIHQIFSTIL